MLNRALLADMIGDAYRIIEAEDGKQAVAALQKEGAGISLVLLDYVMPQMNGFDVLEVMNKNGWIKDIPVIMVSAESDAAYIERAYELGCTHTHFMNPHGLHNESHYTTARDLSLIVQAALKSENFRTITNTAEYTLPATNLSDERVLKTTNMLIFQNSGNRYYYPKAIGIKTGYTTPAGRCVISAAKSSGMYLLGIICGAETTVLETGDIQMESFPECINLFNYGFDNFSYVSVLSPLYPVAQVSVLNSAGAEAVAVSPKDDIQILLPNGYDEAQLDVNIELTNESVEAPVQESDVLGHATVSYNGELLAETDLLAIADVARSEISAMKSDTAAYMQRNWWIVLIIVIVVLLFAGLYVWASIRRRIRRRQRIEQRRNALRERQRRERGIDPWEEDAP